MKTGIHPKYEKTKIKCACGNDFETRSTVSPEISIELCSVCHPFYTGKQKFVDAAGRVDKFQARMKAAEDKKVAKETKKSASTKKEDVSEKKDNKEVLAEIKKDISKPMTVTQEMSSDVETSAASELDETKKEN